MVDEFELKSYSLKDFKLRSLGKDSALVTYMPHYEGKAGGQLIQTLPTARCGLIRATTGNSCTFRKRTLSEPSSRRANAALPC
jgi:hypothetical protein